MNEAEMMSGLSLFYVVILVFGNGGNTYEQAELRKIDLLDILCIPKYPKKTTGHQFLLH